MLVAVCMLLAALAAPAGAVAPAGAAAADPGPATGSGPVLLVPTPGVAEGAARTSPKMIEAMQRDMHLTRAQAITRLGRQHAAGAVEARARRAAGRHFAGSWLNEDGSALMVAVTDQRAAQAVRATGATPALATHSRAELALAQLKLQTHAGKQLGKAVHGWYVDARRNRLVVLAAPGRQSAAAEWVTAADVPAALVTFDQSQGPQKATADLVGGDGYVNLLSGNRCTAGFGVRSLTDGSTGFVTAGHCVERGNFVDFDTVIGGSGGAARAAKSSFPLPPPVTPATRTFDRAYIQLNSEPSNRVLPAVRTSFFSTTPVLGSQAARQGDTVCSFGRVSQYRCGPIVATNQNLLVEYDDGVRSLGQVTVLGLNSARFCSIGGDSGGPVITPGTGQAQGHTVSTTCTGVGFTTTYQPINATQLGLGVRLLFADARPSPPPPMITAFNCYADYGRFTCDLNWEGGTDPDSVQVSTNGRDVRRVDDYDGNFVLLSARCAPVGDTFVSVSVVDADGRRASARLDSFCS
ncbi:S1 family peptidase [Actinomadura soli]|uniref:S1 family peptidase n=1 Tax=Actinomadura soli TaxID=2508997 RepID=UPI001486CD3D|nr:S1 family peptidase [Actinomadura soli]